MRGMHPFAFLFGLPLVTALALGAGSAAPDTGRFVQRTVREGHAKHRYSIWLPPGHESRRDWPAIVFLHGSGECGDDAVKPTAVGLGPQLRAHPEQWPYVVVFPQKPVEDEEWEERETLVFKALDDAAKHTHIDRTRVALVGMSQGGHGAWMIAARHPGFFECVVPVCGYGRARSIQHRLADTPVYAFHGLRDDQVDPNDTRRIVAGLRAARAERQLDPEGARMTLFPDANHDAWDPAFASDSLHAWLREQLEVDAK